MTREFEKQSRDGLTAPRVGKYIILGKIGKGGIGEVYLARDTSLDRKVALKFLTTTTPDVLANRRCLLDEARLAAAIDHPYICKIYGIGEYDGKVFIDMEFVEGQTLKERLKQGPLSIQDALEVSSEIAEALTKAHESGIVHRDLKPGNLIQTVEGHIKILDFGLAVRIPDLSDDSNTQKSFPPLAGTLAYMSPEQIGGDIPDTRSDIFSFGVILYEMIAGSHPFRGATALETLCSIRERAPIPISVSLPSSPPSLRRLVDRMLIKDPERRIQSSRAVLEGLVQVKKDHRSLSESAQRGVRSLAVLPFLNLSTVADNDYFSDGITEEIITRLSQIKGLRVISRTSVMPYKGCSKNVRTIGSELGVENVLEGSVRREKARVRIACSLVEVVSDTKVWSQSYDRRTEDVLAVQREVTQEIATALRTSLSRADRKRLNRGGTRDNKAYHFYLRGRHLLNRMTADALDQAIRYFQKALERDPRYGLASAALSTCYANAGHFGYMPERDAYSRAKAAAADALKLDDSLAEAHASFGFVQFHDWEWASSERAFRRAIRINPNYGDAHVLYSWCLVALARWDEALAEARAALRVDPLSVFGGVNLGWVQLCLNHFDEAMEQFRDTLELAPSNLYARTLMAFCLQGQGFEEKAIQMLEKWAWSKPLLGWGYAVAGRNQEARDVLEEVTGASDTNQFSPAQIALIYFFLGRIDEGLEWLERAYQNHDSQLVHVRANAFAARYFTHPRAEQIFEKMGLEPKIERVYKRMEGHPRVSSILAELSVAANDFHSL